MAPRNFTNFAPAAQLQQDISSSGTSMELDDVTGFPMPPFTAIIDADTSVEEVVLVTGTGGSATTYTIERAFSDAGVPGGGFSFGHAAGAKVQHGATAVEFNNMAKVWDEMTDGAGGVNPPIVKPADGITWGDLV